LAGFVPDDETPQLMAGAEAFIFASYDDFGITPIEALAAGTPVIAYKAGGALDYVAEGTTGAFFDEQTTAAVVAAIKQFTNKKLKNYDTRAMANAYAPQMFKQKMQQFIDTLSLKR
jgi:glycosyltransferase involved in cell wall biosynthesis